jgi:hypothetical protein
VIRLVSMAEYGCFGVIQDVDSASFSLCVLVTKRCERTLLWNFYVFRAVWGVVQFSGTVSANLSIKKEYRVNDR